MRTGLIVSVIGHAVLLLWGIISLPPSRPFDVSNLEAVPVDFIPIDELTKLNIGIATAEAREEIVPEPPAPVIAEVPPEPLPEPPAPDTPDTEPLPPPPEPALAEPPPPPEPAQAEPPPPSEPAQAEAPPPEPIPEPAVAPEPEPPPPPPPKEKKVAQPEPPVPIPRPRPKPPKIVVAKAEPKDTFNPDEISALLDKSKPTGSTQPVEKPPTLGNSTGSFTERMTLSELDALRSQIRQCWNIQLAPPDPSDLIVKVKMFLNNDGSLAQAPQVLEVGSSEFARSAAESAVRAVRRCAPYHLPPDKYDSWREVVMTFDPRDMFGG